jgi:hypothetical protein
VKRETRREAKAYKDVVTPPEWVLENGLRASSERNKKEKEQPHKQQNNKRFYAGKKGTK